MLVSFAAAIQGGLSLETEVTQGQESSKSGSANLTGKFGLSNLFSNLFEVTAEADVAGSATGRNQEIRREHKAHTEASIAILLYDELQKNRSFLTRPKNASDLMKVSPGSLVEVAGILEKNAIDSVIDYIDAVNILSGLANPTEVNMHKGGSQASNKRSKPHKPTELEGIRKILDSDRKRTPISNAILRCSTPPDINVIVTLRTANLRDLTLTELHKNSMRVVGKVTRIIDNGESISAFENYGMSLLNPEVLIEALDEITSSNDVVAEFSEVQINGPAVQILPLMVFV